MYLDALPALLPVPELHSHVIRAGQHKRTGRVDSQLPHIITVPIKEGNLLEGVVVEDTDSQVVRASDDPGLAGNEPGGSDRRVTNLNRLHQSL